MVVYVVQNSSFYIQRKFCFIQRNIFIFRKNVINFRETFSYSGAIFLYLKKSSIFREIAYLKKLFYIHRKFLYL